MAAILVAATPLSGCVDSPAGEPELHFAGDAEAGWRVELTGIGDAEPRLAIYTGTPDQLGNERLPVVGQVSVERGVVRWRPRYSLGAGQTYTAVWRRANGEPLVRVFTTPLSDRAATTVVSAVYPAAESVPENLLRLYVQFSAPMSRGRAREFLELLDADGQAVSGAFVVPEQELWSPAGDRLTLFFDTGRLKQDVGPNLAMGTPLRSGQTITLRVSGAWPDGEGVPLAEGSARTWTVGSADRSRPEPADWTLTAPAVAGAVGVPVELWLTEPLDHALLERLITVESSSGNRIQGRSQVSERDRRWSFTPSEPWTSGAYLLRIDPALEDLAGNSLSRLFDEPLDAERVGTPTMEPVLLPFEVAAEATR